MPFFSRFRRQRPEIPSLQDVGAGIDAALEAAARVEEAHTDYGKVVDRSTEGFLDASGSELLRLVERRAQRLAGSFIPDQPVAVNGRSYEVRLAGSSQYGQYVALTVDGQVIGRDIQSRDKKESKDPFRPTVKEWQAITAFHEDVAALIPRLSADLMEHLSQPLRHEAKQAATAIGVSLPSGGPRHLSGRTEMLKAILDDQGKGIISRCQQTHAFIHVNGPSVASETRLSPALKGWVEASNDEFHLARKSPNDPGLPKYRAAIQNEVQKVALEAQLLSLDLDAALMPNDDAVDLAIDKIRKLYDHICETHYWVRLVAAEGAKYLLERTNGYPLRLEANGLVFTEASQPGMHQPEALLWVAWDESSTRSTEPGSHLVARVNGRGRRYSVEHGSFAHAMVRDLRVLVEQAEMKIGFVSEDVSKRELSNRAFLDLRRIDRLAQDHGLER